MQTEVILIVGKRGTGKSTKAKELIGDKTRVIVAEAGFEEFGVKTVQDFESLIAELRRGFFRVSYTPRPDEWSAFLDAVITCGSIGGPLWLVLEEASRVPRTIPEYVELNIMGRHYGVNMIATSTRASHLPPDYRSQATRVIAFRQSEPADIDYMEDIIGEKALRLPSLPRHEFIDWKESDAWEESPPEDEPEPEPEKIIVDKKPDLM